MRLLIAASAVIAGFLIGVLAIARLTPDSPAWVRLTLATAWLFVVIAGAFLLGNKGQARNAESQRQLRDSLLYVAIAFVFVTVAVGVIIHDVDKGIHRNIKQNWVIGFITAPFVCGYALKAFWHFRHCWRIWAVIVGYLILHFSIAVPALGKLDRIPAIYIWPIGMFEFTLVASALHWVTAAQASD